MISVTSGDAQIAAWLRNLRACSDSPWNGIVVWININTCNITLDAMVCVRIHIILA